MASKGKDVARNDDGDNEIVFVQEHTRRAPAMRGFDKVTIDQRVITTYEKTAKPKKD